VDRAIAVNPKLEAFLNQQREETSTIAEGYQRLAEIIAEADAQV
jgi:flagellum-specific ATP synthase